MVSTMLFVATRSVLPGRSQLLLALVRAYCRIGPLDAVIDFERAIRDGAGRPPVPGVRQRRYLHPNNAGYRAMAGQSGGRGSRAGWRDPRQAGGRWVTAMLGACSLNDGFGERVRPRSHLDRPGPPIHPSHSREALKSVDEIRIHTTHTVGRAIGFAWLVCEHCRGPPRDARQRSR